MKTVSVSQLTAQIKCLIERSALMENILLEGEISNFKRHVSGHCYFTLKDQSAVIRTVMFRSRAETLRIAPVNGLQVIAFGRVAVYERDGNYQFYVERLLPAGTGNLWLQIEQLRDRLTREGLFERPKKRLPFFPSRICVITAPDGAAVRDIVTVGGLRNPAVQLLIIPALMQGAAAATSVIAALEQVNRYKLGDVVIIARGGGSLEDLLPFSDEMLVRAVAASVIPVVAAIGHETDYSLCDYAADARAATPSQAAELTVPDRKALLERIAVQRERLLKAIMNMLDARRNKTAQLLQRRVITQPSGIFEARRIALDNRLDKLIAITDKYLAGKRGRYLEAAAKLSALNPLAVLSRGYAVVEKSDGSMLLSANEGKRGDTVRVRMQGGALITEIRDIVGERDEQEKKH